MTLNPTQAQQKQFESDAARAEKKIFDLKALFIRFRLMSLRYVSIWNQQSLVTSLHSSKLIGACEHNAKNRTVAE